MLNSQYSILNLFTRNTVCFNFLFILNDRFGNLDHYIELLDTLRRQLILFVIHFRFEN